MFNPKRLINFAIHPQEYIWVKATLIKETPKAILIMFDGRKIWLPKTWILETKFPLPKGERVKVKDNSVPISIKISLYNWAKKSQ